MILIIAPHIDDEVIGCFTIIRDAAKEGKPVHVMHLYELTEERVAESKIAESSGFYKVVPSTTDLKAYNEILIPSRKDSHPAHRSVNAFYRRHATGFYSVDMVDAKPLSPELQFEKLNLLNALYPSQKQLWANDAKYWLFQSLEEEDYDTYVHIRVNGITVSCLKIYSEAVTMLAGLGDSPKLDRMFIDLILGACPRGQVTLSVTNSLEMIHARA